ncbi:MAG: LPS export ABC transporter periplasmic protein LptC, partial [Planctomycetes bacterium]|nr:LPS export ABC transporter periplasmic protein LptC [Planctomycetota bacterium]
MPDPQDSTRPNRSFRPPERDTPPPRIRKDRRKIYILIASSAILMALLLVVVTNIETGVETNEPVFDQEGITELIPKALTDAETGGEGYSPDSIGVGLPKGGTIEVANLDGSLAQEYRFTRLNPNPEGKPAGWLEMEKPYAVIYGKDGQIITLSGDQALARAPNRALESGTLTGNVVIRIYQSSPGRRFIPGELQPTATIKTNQAVFDNQLGEIRCDDEVEILSTTLELFGKGLRLQINDQKNIAQLWEIDDVRYILFFSGEKSQDETDLIASARGSHNDGVRPRDITPMPSAAIAPDDSPQTALSDSPASPTTDASLTPAQFYLLT